MAAAKMPPRLVLNEDDIQEAFLKGSGPGGQKIVCQTLLRPHPPIDTTDVSQSYQNKTHCAVQLKHLPTGTVVKSQATRSRAQNRKIARTLLAEKIEAAEKGPESRTALKAEIKRKKKATKTKKARRKYKALQNEGGDEEEEFDDDRDKAVEEELKEERV